ncbi:hypothetical protein [Methylobacterium sp. CCH5-D2]|uniref:hypothetical protein n=1 Tax=Methylobacterium sp. CCH5-D2 TaxID=1768765 RepID=UPI00082FBD56|nr:hypothetical protein [Methylobacterium sp. CCH5-D2]
MSRLKLYRAIGVKPVASPITAIRAELRRYDRKRTCRARAILIPVTEPRGPGSGAHAGRHMQLKLSAQAFLRGQGKLDVTLEQDDRGRVYDVAATCERVAVEVGQTQVSKLLSIAQDGVLAIWLPYRPEGDYQVGDLAQAVALTSPRVRATKKNTPGAIAVHIEQRRTLARAYAVILETNSVDAYLAELNLFKKPRLREHEEFATNCLKLPEPIPDDEPEVQREIEVDWAGLKKAFPFM